MGSGDLNSGLYTCASGTLPTESYSKGHFSMKTTLFFLWLLLQRSFAFSWRGSVIWVDTRQWVNMCPVHSKAWSPESLLRSFEASQMIPCFHFWRRVVGVVSHEQQEHRSLTQSSRPCLPYSYDLAVGPFFMGTVTISYKYLSGYSEV